MRPMPTEALLYELDDVDRKRRLHGLTDPEMDRYRELTAIADDYRTANGGWEGQ